MSRAWRQTVNDDMAAAINRARGVLTIQEFTTLALARALDEPTTSELRRELGDLQRDLEALRGQLDTPGQSAALVRMSASSAPAVERLSF